MKQNLIAIILMISTLFIIPIIYAQNTLTISTESNETLMPKGEWQDPTTGLIWMRCSLGQTWASGKCQGQLDVWLWGNIKDAIERFNREGGFNGHTNWRIASREDFLSIRKCSRGLRDKTSDKRNETIRNDNLDSFCVKGSKRPTVDTTIFPNTPAGSYWYFPSSSFLSHANSFSFYDGSITPTFIGSNNYYLRVVRSSD